MHSLFAVIKYKPLLLTGFAWGWFQVEHVPPPMQLFFLGMTMCIDLVTGLTKSWKKGKATTSAGLQRSVVKLTRYCSVILATWCLANVMTTMSPISFDYSFLVTGAISFLTIIEVYSVFENIYEHDPNSLLSRWFVGRMLRLLRGQLRNHPFDKLPDNENDK